MFILAGDGPLIRGEVLRTLHNAHHDEHAAASMATAVLDDPTGYGRIIRDADGEFLEIVEQIDCTPRAARDPRSLPELLLRRSRDDLLFALSQLKNENKKGEYYLTDIYGILRKRGQEGRRGAGGDRGRRARRSTRREQLAEVDAVMQDRIQRQLSRRRRDDRQRRSTRTSKPA